MSAPHATFAYLVAVCGWPLAICRALRAALRLAMERLRRPLWRHCLSSLGSRSRIQGGVRIYAPRLVSLGDDCLIARGVQIVTERSSGRLVIGNRVQVNVDVHLDHTGGLTLGDEALVSEGAMVYTHSHGHDPKSPPQATPLVIGRGAWIGARAVVLPGVGQIGPGAIVGAGAIVTREVPTGAVVAGNPARVIGRRDDRQPVAGDAAEPLAARESTS